MNGDICHIFLTVVETQSYTKASEKLHITPSGISQAMARLEEEIGVVLFYRSSRGVKLTSEGERLYEYIERVYSAEIRLEKEIDDIKNTVSGRITIGTNASICARLIPNVIKKMKKQYPELEVDLVESGYDVLSRELKNNAIDIVLCSKSMADADMEFLPLFEDEIVCVTSKEYQAPRSRDYLKLEEVMKSGLIAPGSANDSDTKRLFIDNGIHYTAKMYVDDDVALLSLVESGLGIGMLPELELTCFHKDINYFHLEKPYYRTLGIAYRKDIPLAQTVRAAIDVVRTCIDDYLEDKE